MVKSYLLDIHVHASEYNYLTYIFAWNSWESIYMAHSQYTPRAMYTYMSQHGVKLKLIKRILCHKTAEIFTLLSFGWIRWTDIWDNATHGSLIADNCSRSRHQNRPKWWTIATRRVINGHGLNTLKIPCCYDGPQWSLCGQAFGENHTWTELLKSFLGIIGWCLHSMPQQKLSKQVMTPGSGNTFDD